MEVQHYLRRAQDSYDSMVYRAMKKNAAIRQRYQPSMLQFPTQMLYESD